MLVIRAKIHKMLVRIAKRKVTGQTPSPEAGLVCQCFFCRQLVFEILNIYNISDKFLFKHVIPAIQRCKSPYTWYKTLHTFKLSIYMHMLNTLARLCMCMLLANVKLAKANVVVQ